MFSKKQKIENLEAILEQLKATIIKKIKKRSLSTNLSIFKLHKAFDEQSVAASK